MQLRECAALVAAGKASGGVVVWRLPAPVDGGTSGGGSGGGGGGSGGLTGGGLTGGGGSGGGGTGRGTLAIGGDGGGAPPSMWHVRAHIKPVSGLAWVASPGAEDASDEDGVATPGGGCGGSGGSGGGGGASMSIVSLSTLGHTVTLALPSAGTAAAGQSGELTVVASAAAPVPTPAPGGQKLTMVSRCRLTLSNLR
jgi:hypothetical protein